MKLLSIENLSYSVWAEKRIKRNILKNINLEISKGEITGIAGESGSGKTTLLKIIAGLYKADTGSIIMHEKGKRNGVQLLFQNNGEIINPARRVGGMINDVLKRRGVKKVNDARDNLLTLLKLPSEIITKRGNELSGGEQQRTALARILAADPELLLLDEPFSAQDWESERNLIDIFTRLRDERGITMICVSHDIHNLKEICSRIVIMYNGEIIEQGGAEEIFNNPKEEYTKFLIRSEKYDLKREDFSK